jgi:hypothetical protein
MKDMKLAETYFRATKTYRNGVKVKPIPVIFVMMMRQLVICCLNVHMPKMFGA